MAVTLNASTSTGYIQTADTSGDLALQSNGTTQFTVTSTGAYGQLKSGTAVASTSGTSIDFTSIPSWVKRITVMFNGVSTNGTTNILLQLGSGSVTSSGYTSISAYAGATNAAGATSSTAGLVINTGTSNTTTFYGHTTIDLLNASTNTWVAAHLFGISQGATLYSVQGGGVIALSGTLDRVRVTTVSGTDTFDAGSINILYEG